MLKICSAQDWAVLRDRPTVEIKISSNGYMLSDRLKVAKETGDEFLHRVREIEDQLDRKNHKFAHVITCGAAEVTGPNRNADAWSAESLRNDMPSFLKHAKCYRDHRNSPDDLYYGLPKVAMYDEQRGYGRLLAALFATEKSLPDKLARVADAEIDVLDRGDSFRVSHGLKLSHDVCASCGNQAATRSKYCMARDEGGDCTLFGCRHGLSKIAEDGRMQYTLNPSNRFYDISSIGLSGKSARQADRVAYASSIDDILDKTASEGGAVHGSAYLADVLGLDPRYDLQTYDGETQHHREMIKVAAVLSQAEAGQPILLADDPVEHLSALFHSQDDVRRSAVHKLAAQGQLPSAFAFARAGGADEQVARAVQNLVPAILPTAYRTERLPELIKASCFTNNKTQGTWSGFAVACSSVNNVTDPRYTFLVSADGAMRPRSKAADEKRFSSEDVSQLTKLATDYIGMKILFASRVLETANTSSSFSHSGGTKHAAEETIRPETLLRCC